MSKKQFISLLTLLFTLASVVSASAGATHPIEHEWACHGTPYGVLCYYIESPGAEVQYGELPAGLCPGLTESAGFGTGDDGIEREFFISYMVPCTDEDSPSQEVSNEAIALIEKAEVGTRITNMPLPGNVIEVQSATSFTLYEDKGGGLIFWRYFEKSEDGSWVKKDEGFTQLAE